MNTKLILASLFATFALSACAVPAAEEGDMDGVQTEEGPVGENEQAATTCTPTSPGGGYNAKYRGCYFENTSSYWRNTGTNCSLIVVYQNGGNFACNVPGSTTKLLGRAADISSARFAGGGVCATNHTVGSCWSL